MEFAWSQINDNPPAVVTAPPGVSNAYVLATVSRFPVMALRASTLSGIEPAMQKRRAIWELTRRLLDHDTAR